MNEQVKHANRKPGNFRTAGKYKKQEFLLVELKGGGGGAGSPEGPVNCGFAGGYASIRHVSGESGTGYRADSPEWDRELLKSPFGGEE